MTNQTQEQREETRKLVERLYRYAERVGSAPIGKDLEQAALELDEYQAGIRTAEPLTERLRKEAAA